MQLAAEVFVLEPTLMVIGLNYRTAPLAMRERFFIGEKHRYEVLRRLSSAEGVEEVVVLSVPCRTEFIIWASEPTLAANSLLHFLGKDHGLKLTEWEHFYRLLDDAALSYLFRLVAGLDSLVLGRACHCRAGSGCVGTSANCRRVWSLPERRHREGAASRGTGAPRNQGWKPRSQLC